MAKKKYERPTIIRHISDLADKFGRAKKLRAKEEIDGIPVRDLVRQYGSPLFVFSEKSIRRSYRDAIDLLLSVILRFSSPGRIRQITLMPFAGYFIRKVHGPRWLANMNMKWQNGTAFPA
ncbi:MAG: hypothetical protein JRG69_10565, partial [Deltaproteobacteria bacterium]|nr:hypothetical protein [Deltaproteobacteria bacterium]